MRIANDYAFKIIDGAHEILIYPDGEVVGFPVARQYADGVTEVSKADKPRKLVLFNRIPRLVAAAEQLGYSLGQIEAAGTQFHVENAVPPETEVQEE